ncbi:hypothetical protein JD844_015405 [Phrynosoma platyrhinos]|uniref:Uncharacterized protein n=1 Tax=Phrynosoma platyrhinos TaxID=52577 RepID=A0ABQ7SJ49_PHRPL|nr:hypothetical protein JD844_015405 [Phrynosoma platyrhinos]
MSEGLQDRHCTTAPPGPPFGERDPPFQSPPPLSPSFLSLSSRGMMVGMATFPPSLLPMGASPSPRDEVFPTYFVAADLNGFDLEGGPLRGQEINVISDVDGILQIDFLARMQ